MNNPREFQPPTNNQEIWQRKNKKPKTLTPSHKSKLVSWLQLLITQSMAVYCRQADGDPNHKIMGDACKLLANAVHGKCIQNKLQATNVRLCRGETRSSAPVNTGVTKGSNQGVRLHNFYNNVDIKRTERCPTYSCPRPAMHCQGFQNMRPRKRLWYWEQMASMRWP